MKDSLCRNGQPDTVHLATFRQIRVRDPASRPKLFPDLPPAIPHAARIPKRNVLFWAQAISTAHGYCIMTGVVADVHEVRFSIFDIPPQPKSDLAYERCPPKY